MNTKKYLLLSSLALLLSSCSGGGIDDIAGKGIASGYVKTYPQTISGQLHNDGMGWCALEEQTELGKLDLGKNGTIPECDVIGIQTSWALIEKTPGNFDWSLIDKTIDYWTNLGKRINFRICTDSLSLPEVYFGAPKWINESPYNVHYEEYQYSGDMMARVNDLTDPTYQRLFENFLDKLAERYIDNAYLDTVDIRGYGMYGEWHSGHSFANMNERMETLAYITDQYQERFAKNGIQLFLSNSWDYQGGNKDGSTASTYGNCSYEDYLSFSSIDHAMYLDNVGYRRDGLAGNGCTKYATDEKALVDLFRSGKKTSISGEYFSGIANYKSGSLGMSPMEATDELLFKSRCNYSTALGWVNTEVVNILESEYADVFDRGNIKMGYRFKIDSAQYPETVKQGNIAHTLVTISNSGVGRFTLEDHNIRLMIIDQNGKIKQTYDNKDYDLRILTNGEILNVYSDIKIDSSLSDGEYTLAISIVDKDGNPHIRFANVGDYDNKIYPLGKINIGNAKQLKDIDSSFKYENANSHKLKANKQYEVTFEYTPSFELKDYLFGDESGYELHLVNGSKNIKLANWQDVSEEKAIKTISFSTEDISNAHLEIIGTGGYENKIQVGNMRIAEKTGYITRINKDYNLLSVDNAWYSDTDICRVEEQIGKNNDGAIVIDAIVPHKENDGLFSDPELLKIKPNTSYTISFDTKGYSVGGNGAYSYLKLVDGEGNEQIIGEWYDRPDEQLTNKTFTFVSGKQEGLHFVFGEKNVGGYIIDNINLLENAKGTIVKGEDHPIERNVRPYDEEKLTPGYVEGFENGVCNDSTFTYGFNRWGSLTNNKEEVIDGNFSFSSRIEEETYKAFKDNDWFEFFYSNSKYMKFKANTKYKIVFDYKVTEKIMLNTDNESSGYAYMLFRSSSRADSDSKVINFGGNVTINQRKKMTTYLTTGNATDYYMLIGLCGRGVMIIDNICITEAI